MDSMGWPCSILLHGQILPFRVMFHALTRYMLLCLWAALSASRKILHPSDEIMWHSSRKTSMIAIVLWVQVVIGSNQRGFSQVKLRPKYESGKLFPFEYGHAATYQGDCQDHWASEWHHNGMSYTKKIPISSSIGDSKDFVIGWSMKAQSSIKVGTLTSRHPVVLQ